MSLRGAWTKTPGRPPPVLAAGVDRSAGRADLSRDIVSLPYLLALDGPADDVRRGPVGLDQVDLDLAEVAGVAALPPEQVQLVADGQPVVRADRDVDLLVTGV